MKFIFAFFLLAFSQLTFSSGAASDIPFALFGQLNIVDSSYSNDQYPITSCEVTMSGRTNSKNSAASITSIRYTGGPNCLAYGEQFNQPYAAQTSIEWDTANPSNVKISNIYFDARYADCTGDIVAKKIEGKLMIFSQKIGSTCTVSGSLGVVSTPALY